MFGKKKPVKILFVIDWENLIINSRKGIPPERYSLEEGFNQIIEQLTEEIGEIIGIWAFVPPNRALIWGKDIDNLGFNIILCPKDENEGATDDTKLRKLTKWFIDCIPGLTHVCLGSGDKHFIPLLQDTALKGLKKIIVAGDLRSLSPKLIGLASKKPNGKGRMVYIFSPTS